MRVKPKPSGCVGNEFTLNRFKLLGGAKGNSLSSRTRPEAACIVQLVCRLKVPATPSKMTGLLVTNCLKCFQGNIFDLIIVQIVLIH